MYVQAIALPRGASLLWIRVGELLDASFAHRPNEVVQRIIKIAAGFQVETKEASTGVTRCYEAASCFVSRVEPQAQLPLKSSLIPEIPV